MTKPIMEPEYKVFVNIKDWGSAEILLGNGVETLNEKDTEALMKGLSDSEAGYFKLKNGNMVSIPEAKMRDVFFTAVLQG